MIASVLAEIYVLSETEGGCEPVLYSGFLAEYRSDEFDDGIILTNFELHTMQAGDSGNVVVTFLRPELQSVELTDGQMFRLSIDGAEAAVGQILSVEEEDVLRHVEETSGEELADEDEEPGSVALISRLISLVCVLVFLRGASIGVQIAAAIIVNMIVSGAWNAFTAIKGSPGNDAEDSTEERVQGFERELP